MFLNLDKIFCLQNLTEFLRLSAYAFGLSLAAQIQL